MSTGGSDSASVRRTLDKLKNKLDELILDESTTMESSSRKQRTLGDAKLREEQAKRQAEEHDKQEVERILAEAKERRKQQEVPFEDKKHPVVATADVQAAQRELNSLLREEQAALKRKEKLAKKQSLLQLSPAGFTNTQISCGSGESVSSSERVSAYSESATTASMSMGSVSRNNSASAVRPQLLSPATAKPSGIMSASTSSLRPPSRSSTLVASPPMSQLSPTKRLPVGASVVERQQRKHVEELEIARAQLQAQQKYEEEYAQMRSNLRQQILKDVFGLSHDPTLSDFHDGNEGDSPQRRPEDDEQHTKIQRQHDCFSFLGGPVSLAGNVDDVEDFSGTGLLDHYQRIAESTLVPKGAVDSTAIEQQTFIGCTLWQLAMETDHRLDEDSSSSAVSAENA